MEDWRTGITVGDVLRHKARSAETTTQWAKRIGAEARRDRYARSLAGLSNEAFADAMRRYDEREEEDA